MAETQKHYGLKKVKQGASIKELIPVRSLWTNIRTGQQVIITALSDDCSWVNKLMVGKMGYGGCAVSHLLDNYVMASEGCDIEVRAHG